MDTNKEKKQKNIMADSYCIEYVSDEDEFLIALAKKNENKFDIKAAMTLDVENFKSYFSEVLNAVECFQKNTNRNLIQEIVDDMLRKEK